MRRIETYRTLADAMTALDNGGRFYHLFAHARDARITPGELKKGTEGSGMAHSALAYSLAVRALSDDERARLESTFTENLVEALAKRRPTELTPAEFAASAEPGEPYVVSGDGTEGEDRIIHSTIMLPIQVGNVTSFTTMPVQTSYEAVTLRVRGAPDDTPCTALVPKGEAPPPGPVTLAGFARESRNEHGKPTEDPPYLEAMFTL